MVPRYSSSFSSRGLGVFAYAGFFFWHAVVNASVIFVLPVLLVLIGWMGGVPGRLLWLAAAISGLTVLQSLLIAWQLKDPGAPSLASTC